MSPVELFVLLSLNVVLANTAEIHFEVYSVLPSLSPIAGGVDLLIQGDAFFPSDNIKCSFTQDHSNYYIVNGSFSSINEIRCTTPKVNRDGDYFLEISEDGVNYSNTQAIIVNFFVEAPSKSELFIGVIVLSVFFSLCAIGMVLYFWRKRKASAETHDPESAFSLLPGINGDDPSQSEL